MQIPGQCENRVSIAVSKSSSQKTPDDEFGDLCSVNDSRNGPGWLRMTGLRIVERLAEGASAQGHWDNWLLVLDVPERQVNAWLSNVWLFGDLVLKVFLGFSRHDQQTPVGQPFRKGNSSVLPFKTK